MRKLISIVSILLLTVLIIKVCSVTTETDTEEETQTPVGYTYAKHIEPTTTEPPHNIVDVPLDAPTQHWLYGLCSDYNVDFYIILAMIEIESHYNPDAVNDSGTCVGYMQVNPTYHSMGMDITAPLSNLLAGVSLMQRLLEHSGNDYTWALNAYNGGGAYADSIHGETYYSETVKQIAERIKNGI